MNELAIFASPLPFSNARIKTHAFPGSSIREIVDLVCPRQLKDVGAVVFINGEIIPEEKWADERPAIGTHIAVNIVPTGGGGKKSVIGLVLSIVIAIAAPGIGSTLGIAAFEAGAVGSIGAAITLGKVISVGIGIVGKLLVSALAPPPKPSNLGSGNVSNPTESPTLFIEGARNILDPFGVVPICLGTNRMIPPQAARPYTETKSGDQFVRQLFTWGFGDRLVIGGFKFGETDVKDFEEVDFEHRLRGNLSTATKIYPRDVFQEDFSVLLEESNGYTERTTPLDVDEAVVDVTFPQGLTKFNDAGKRLQQAVRLELQYSPAGMNDWSPAAVSFKHYDGEELTVEDVPISSTQHVVNEGGVDYYIGYRRDLVVIDIYTGRITLVEGNNRTFQNSFFREVESPTQAVAPQLPANKIRLSTLLVKTKRRRSDNVDITTIESHTDDRNPSLFGQSIETSSDFDVSTSGNDVTVTDGAIKTDQLYIRSAQVEALRKSVRVIFPESGQYDLRIRRVTDDTNNDRILDKAYLTAIKSIKYEAPVLEEGVNGTAIRIKATSQLSGALEQFNAIVSNVIPDYNSDGAVWGNQATSNPASIYRYVLQGAANSRPLADSKIDLDALEAWHVHCDAQGYSYNRVIDFETSVEEILRDVAAAGAASPAIVDGKRTVVVDMIKDDIVQIITPRNSWGYSAELTYPELPHAFRVQFRNNEKGYVQDEAVVYDDGYDEDNAEVFEGLELQSCTNYELGFKTARRHIASARLRPEVHSWMMDIENLVALRGDRVLLAHDIPLVGIGDGRIKSITDNGTNVTGFSIDDEIAVPDDSIYYVRIRLADGTLLYKQVITSVGYMSDFVFTTPFALADTPAIGDLAYFVEAGGELDLIITKIEPQDDLTAKITGINYAPEIFDAENSVIPPFESNVTTPLEFIRPVAPILLTSQSDESVMLINSDGTVTPRAVFTFRNDNEGAVQTLVRVRRTGDDSFTNANVLESTPERVVLTGLDDGYLYDLEFRYQRANSNIISLPLILNSYLFIGASEIPPDIDEFRINVSDNTALFNWTKSTAVDHSHYKMKFSAAFSGATWNTAQIFVAEIQENRLAVPFVPGTYLIKDVDLSGNESANATVITTFDPGLTRNVIEELVEHPTFAGTKDNTAVDGSALLTLGDTDSDGYYYFANSLDLGGVFVSSVSASIVANGLFVNNVFDMDDVFEEEDIFGVGDNDVFAMDDIFEEDDIFGIGTDSWEVQLQYRTTPFVEELIVNGTFPTDISGWTDASTLSEYIDWDATGKLRLVSSGAGYAKARQTLTVEDGKEYTINFTPAGAMTYQAVSIGTAPGLGDILSLPYPIATGAQSHTFTAIGTTVYLEFNNGGGTSTFDNVSIIDRDWSEWQEFVAGSLEFREIEFRVLLRSLATNISPGISVLSVLVDMPDRIERGEDLVTDPVTKIATVTFPQPFKNVPATTITTQDGATDDRIDYLSKTSSGFSFKVYNATAAGYVDRSYDHITSGYGRLNV